MKAKRLPKYWYFISFYECPVCGHSREYRERQYTEKPFNVNDRYEWIPSYDNCMEF